LMFGEGATFILDGQVVVPARAQELGYTFQHPRLDEALRDLIA
jgi:NAD dependent epimerase/dehydratase family enzyme